MVCSIHQETESKRLVPWRQGHRRPEENIGVQLHQWYNTKTILSSCTNDNFPTRI